MRVVRWFAVACLITLLPQGAVAVESCESLSARYLSTVMVGARTCLVRQVPNGRGCGPQSRIPTRWAAKLNTYCAAGTVERLACTARQAITAAGLSYASLTGSGFTHICNTSACANNVLEPGEQCDDGNVVNADGCSSTCQFEAGACNDLCAGVAPVAGTAIKAERIASGLSSPLYVTAPPRDVSRVFIVEQTGKIKIIKWGSMLPAPFIDLGGNISCCGERGLLGLAFHPDYVDNGRFFVFYTNPSGRLRVGEYAVSADPDIAATSESLILDVAHPAGNHNGGWIGFGPDGYLYVAIGDGGGGGDPDENGQDTGVLLGKMLRLDVDSGAPYSSPASNPFFGATPGLDEIWAYGLRNPWRNSFDRLNGDFYIADVGQNQYEEINYQPGVSSGGVNYGWDVVEGAGHCFEPMSMCDQTGMTLPVHEYNHGDGCSITGGYVYRGCALPDLRGTYFYADYCSAFVRTFEISAGAATNHQDRTGDLESAGANIDLVSSFGEDARGELYIVDAGGEVFKIVPGP